MFFPGSSSASQNGGFSPCRFVNPKDLHDSGEFPGNKVEDPQLHNLSDLETGRLGGYKTNLTTRSRKSSLLSSILGLSDDGEEVVFNKPVADLLEDGEGSQPAMDVESNGPTSRSSQYDEEVHQSMGIDLTEPLPDSSDEEEVDNADVGKSNGPSLDSSDGEGGGDGEVLQEISEDVSDPLVDRDGDQRVVDVELSKQLSDKMEVEERDEALDISEDEGEDGAIIKGRKADASTLLESDGDGDEDQDMVDVELSKQASDKLEVEERGEASDISEDERENGAIVRGRKADASTLLESDGDGDEDQDMVDVELSKQASDKLEVEERGEALDISEDIREADDDATLISDTLVESPTPIELRRSSRLAPLKKMPIALSHKTHKVTAGKKQSAVKKNGIFPLVRV
jgi:hypothetical protein